MTMSSGTRRAVVMSPTARGWRARRAQRKEHKALTRQILAGSKGKEVKDGPDPDLDLMPMSKWWGKLTTGAMWGPVTPRTPMHEVSTARIGVATPFLASSAGNLAGPVIGIDAGAGTVFRFDPWSAYRAGLVTSPGVVVFGKMGTGKSTCVKTVALRLVHAGRHVIVQNDPKGEWAPIARALGGPVLRIDPAGGAVLNPLESGVRPEGQDEEEWNSTVAARRATMLRAVVSVLRSGARFTEREEAALDLVLADITQGRVEATLTGVYEALANPTVELVGVCGTEAPSTLALVLRRVVHGSLAGMFEKHSSVELDQSAPMTVVDTSALLHATAEVRALASACIGAWVDSVLRSRDGRFRLVISEEGWAELRDPYIVAAMDERLRMAGEWRCSNWLIFHELEDMDQFGEEGSAQRHQVRGLISKSPIKIIYGQSATAVPNATALLKLNPDEAELLTTLPQGVGLWRIGESAPVLVHPLLTQRAYELFNTDAGREG